jgi:glycyl-tRNA synthetase (class II)
MYKYVQKELAHYARACTDITFKFPFGVQELMGVAARGNFDLTAHGNGELLLHLLSLSYVCLFNKNE